MGMIGFLAFLVQKLWPKNGKKIREIPRKPFGDNLLNKQWGYFETTISSMRAFRYIAHADSMSGHQVITIQNLCLA